MFQQDQCDRAAQTWLSDWVTRDDLRFCTRETVLPDSFLDNWTDLVPGTSDFANYNDHVRGETRNERRDASSEVIRHLPQGIHCLAIALLSESQEMIEADRLFPSVETTSTTG